GRRPRTREARMRPPPGPKDGCFGLCLLLRLYRDPLRFTLETFAKYGDLVHGRVGPYRLYLASHPDLVADVLVRQAKSFRKLQPFAEVFDQLGGQGLLVSEGDRWVEQRRRAQSVFRADRMD